MAKSPVLALWYCDDGEPECSYGSSSDVSDMQVSTLNAIPQNSCNNIYYMCS
jgi:hypothetical protein